MFFAPDPLTQLFGIMNSRDFIREVKVRGIDVGEKVRDL